MLRILSVLAAATVAEFAHAGLAPGEMNPRGACVHEWTSGVVVAMRTRFTAANLVLIGAACTEYPL